MFDGKKVIGLVFECNPFHAGHKKLIKEARKHGDYLVAIMSGNFVQRGEPAVYDKYRRTKDLLKSGVDLVIELPIEYVLSSAKYFARGSISILDSLNLVDNVIFGSKINNIDKLTAFSKISTDINTSDDIFNEKIKEQLKKGLSYPKAMSNIYNENLSANDILGIEYIRAIKDLKSKIIPLCIKRDEKLPSATELRKKIKKKIDIDSFTEILNYKLLCEKNMLYNSKNSLKYIYGMTNDLYNAVMKDANTNLSFSKRALKLNTKNRTLANIKRLFLNIIFDIRNTIKDDKCFAKYPTYIRILGMRNKAFPMLKYFKVPYLLGYNPSSYKNAIKNFKTIKAIKCNKKGEFILSDSINKNVFASNLYYNLSKLNFLESGVEFLKLT